MRGRHVTHHLYYGSLAEIGGRQLVKRTDKIPETLFFDPVMRAPLENSRKILCAAQY
jgi:hypothetical protein